MRMRTHVWSPKKVKEATVPNYSKLYVTQPAIFDILPSLRGKKLLEVGCGNGYWLRLFHSKGAQCVGVDVSKNQLAEAQKRNESEKTRIIYYPSNGADLKVLGSQKFDIVFLEKVLLEVPALSQIRKMMKEAYRVTQKGGILVVSELHPAAVHFNIPNFKLTPEYGYFNSGSTIKVISKRVDGNAISYTDYHWTLEDICNAITDTGFKIVKITEPRPRFSTVHKYPYLKYREGTPVDLLIKAIK